MQFFLFLFPLRDQTTIEKTEKKNSNIKHYSNILLCIKKILDLKNLYRRLNFFASSNTELRND